MPALTSAPFRKRFCLSGLLVLQVFCASWADTDHSQPSIIAFESFKGQTVIPVSVGAGSAHAFLFDTGLTQGNILSADLARALDIKPTRQVKLSDSSGQARAVDVAMIDTVSVGPVTLHNAPFALMPLPAALSRRPDGPDIVGVMGAPLLKDAVVCLDYQNKRIMRWSPAATFSAGQRRRLPLEFLHDQPTITIDIDGLRATVVVDTGSNGGVQLFPAFARAHDLGTKYPGLRQTKSLSGHGQISQSYQGTARRVTLGDDVKYPNIPLAIIPQSFPPAWGIDGLIGAGFLSRLAPCLDEPSEGFYWTP